MSGQHQVPHAKRRAHAARERVGVDDALGGVDALHGGDGPAGQTELAVVVILHHVAALGVVRPAQKLVAAADGRDQPRGELMRGHKVRHACARRPQSRHADARAVERHMRKLHVVRPVDAGQTRIARVFHREAPPPAQKLHQQVVQRLRARPHHDARGVGLHSAKRPQMSGQRLAQPNGPHGGRLAQKRPLRFMREHIAHGARPRAVGKQLGSHLPAREIGQKRLFGGGDRGPGGAVRNPGRNGAACGRRRNRRAAARARRRAIHGVREEPAPRLRAHIPLGHQLAVRPLHCDQAHAEVLGKGAL